MRNKAVRLRWKQQSKKPTTLVGSYAAHGSLQKSETRSITEEMEGDYASSEEIRAEEL